MLCRFDQLPSPARWHPAHPDAPGPRAGARARASGPWGERPRVRRRTRMRGETRRTARKASIRQSRMDAEFGSGRILMNKLITKFIVQIIKEARIPQIVSSILPSEKAKISWLHYKHGHGDRSAGKQFDP